MTCAECQRLQIERLDEAPGPDVTAHLLECAACRKAHQGSETVKLLLALKRHEIPDPHFEVRNAARVREAIADLKPGRGLGWAEWAWLQKPPALAFRVAAALALLGSISLILAVRLGNAPLPHVTQAEQPSFPLHGSDLGPGDVDGKALVADTPDTNEIRALRPLPRPPALPASL